jgi:hypothetical protein
MYTTVICNEARWTLKPEYYFRYSKLRSIGRNDLANEILESFNQKNPVKIVEDLILKNVNF